MLGDFSNLRFLG